MAVPENLVLAPKVRDLFFDDYGNWRPSRYKVMRGGRAGLKTWGFARAALCLASARRVRFLCARELQSSIEESVHHTLTEQIDALNLTHYFDVQKRAIENRFTGAEFIFRGIRDNPRKIKSTEGIDVAWVEEAEKVSDDSWQILIPTIRKPGSEIWVGFNPDLETDPTSQRFIENPPPGARIIETNWRDNPWMSLELQAEKDYLARVDPDAYAHVWEGGYRRNSEAQIFKGKYVVDSFEPAPYWNGPYQGADWGFSTDPSAFVRMWIFERRLFIEYEAWGLGVDIDATPALFDAIPGANEYVTRGDCARPETISYLQRHGYPRLEACSKWEGCVEDGIAFLRQFEEIVIHPRCEHTIQEARLYSYKVDRLTGDVLPDVVDKHNHCWDAARYGLEPLIKNPGSWAFGSM